MLTFTLQLLLKIFYPFVTWKVNLTQAIKSLILHVTRLLMLVTTSVLTLHMHFNNFCKQCEQ
jgi:hypothetical protein